MVSRARVCLLCGGEFEPVAGPGRPRHYCYDCAPRGWQVVRVSPRSDWRERKTGWGLRRRPPGWSRADLVPTQVEWAYVVDLIERARRGGKSSTVA